MTIGKNGFSQGSLRIEEVEVKEGNTLVFRFSVPRNLRRYLYSDSFYVKYDISIEDVPRSIQYIPGIAGLVTLCWAKNIDIHVEELDSRYLKSMPEVREVLNEFYPNIGFHGDIICEREVDNSFGNDGTSLLFSGGIDSTSLYLENRGMKPTLFSFIGGVIPVENQKFIDLFKQTYSGFAEREGVKIHFIETNIRSVLNEALLWSENRDELIRPWWEFVSQGIVYLSLCSPITLKDIGRLKIASSRTLQIEDPYGSDPRIDNKIGWGDVEVVHSQLEYDRQEKVHRFIKGFMEEEGVNPSLQVCNYAPIFLDGLNCNRCRRCLKAIISLLLDGIDPTMCGFEIGEDVYKKIKKDVIPNADWINNWRIIQERIDLEENEYLHNSEEFFRWLKEANLEAINDPGNGFNLEKILLPIQARLPRMLQNKVLKAYYRWRYGE